MWRSFGGSKAAQAGPCSRVRRLMRSTNDASATRMITAALRPGMTPDSGGEPQAILQSELEDRRLHIRREVDELQQSAAPRKCIGAFDERAQKHNIDLPPIAAIHDDMLGATVERVENPPT